MRNDNSASQILTGDIAAQVLGLTEQHIYFFEPEMNSKKLGIHQLMLNDFLALSKAAAQADIELKIASGYRSFERQLLIWNNKFTGKTAIKNAIGETVNINQLSDIEIINAILLFSALPGTSRHHWGTDIDVYAENLLNGEKLQLEPWEYDKTGPMAKLSSWLTDNAGKFGFYFPYDQFRGGVAIEPWHLSYAPLAKQYQSVLNIELLQVLLAKTNIAGQKMITKHIPQIFKQYINNINVV
tara:strand:+ start:3000 stop:3722 length:723 start_codon:yes stop_codon:yes gene_type:complete